ncbi:MAG: sulfatase-like hydrolase/transferase [Elusimicrobia bacterium]|nr:sulfatase-like hydrolase/transferase [Elusimicrobiota bacterium]
MRRRYSVPEAVFRFALFNFFVSLLLGIPYLLRIKTVWFFSVIAYISNFAVFHILLFLAILFLSIFFGEKIKFAASLFYVLFHFVIFVDIFIYKFYRFHLNSMALNLLTTKGGWQTLCISPGFAVSVLTVSILLYLLEIFVFGFLSGFRKSPHPAKKILSVLAAGVLIIFADKCTFAVGDILNNTRILSAPFVFPFYKPMTMKKFLMKFGVRPKKKKVADVNLSKNAKNGILDYPKEKLVFRKKRNLPNIVFILVDSMRGDMFDAEIAPRIYGFSKISQVFRNHFSGGNCTRFGVFSLFYGIYGYYWFNFLAARRSPVFIDELKKLGYDLRILAASELTFPELRSTCFVNVKDENIIDRFKAPNKIARDKYIADNLINWIKERKSKRPFFAFVFFDCPHGSYDYPKRFEKFKPARRVNYLEINRKTICPLFNKYKNSIGYDDYLVGEIISALRRKKILSNTIVLISGDHGEEFYEHGFYGHNGGFSDEQTRVTFVFYVPGRRHREYGKLTSHLDVVPTIFEILGCKNPPSDYSQGFSLFSSPAARDVVIATWDKLAVRTAAGGVTVVPFSSKFGKIVRYDSGYNMISASPDNERILKLSRELRYFLK